MYSVAFHTSQCAPGQCVEQGASDDVFQLNNDEESIGQDSVTHMVMSCLGALWE